MNNDPSNINKHAEPAVNSPANTLTTIASPCIDICALDENDICIGCYRHGNEISQWGGYSNEEKIVVLKKSQLRSET